ncbi:RsmB/NOP family class I SAM-dependent RNA methyltransferase [Saccharospirillum mangrovi]|uniref:RsmB/NOP family class I SAM-dependent RNA methyltransferase n=1 Tax=Saccharospirillum mangrovi TaxID=2161747 RepID=UPI000D356D83|nr:RsmB/NOP family class I SAM-dependent RNA methyltransferase [Saccharospirillum mangrovi]
MTAHAWPGYRWPHLFKLTEALLLEPSWPSTDRWLAERFRVETKFGRKDRAFYSDALFRLCRQAAVPVFLHRRWSGDDSDISGDRIWSQLQTMSPADIWSWLVMIDGADSQLPKEIHDSEQRRAWLDALPTPDRDLLNQLLTSWLPEWNGWLDERARVSDWSADEQAQWLSMQNQRPPLWLRLASGHEDAAQASLEQAGFAIQSRHDRALAVAAKPGLERTDAWQSGWIEIQDKASQAVVETMALSRGDHCWDVCAGAGGKALAMLDVVQPSGQVLATDIRPGALNQSRQRAARLGLNGLTTAVMDGSESLPDAAPFDAVLVDAPCTGAGTWRRSPDARWRLTTERLTELNHLQDALLNQASGAVTTGGQLVYATCSWLVAENEQRVSAFLAAHPEFELHQQRLLGAPSEDADTLFVAVMIRR